MRQPPPTSEAVGPARADEVAPSLDPTRGATGPAASGGLAAARAEMTVVFHNVNGISLKDEEVVRAADSIGAHVVGISETQLYRERTLCTGVDGDSSYRWIFGLDAERAETGRASGGVAFLVSHRIAQSVSLARAERNQLWIRMKDKQRTVYVCVVYLPPSGASYAAQRRQTLEALADNAARYRSQGAAVIIGGDLNARTAANGDTVMNAEGKDLLAFVEANSLRIVNFDQERCHGLFTRERKYGEGFQRSTLDYALVDGAHYHLVQQLRICDDPDLRLGSDHKPLRLTVAWELNSVRSSSVFRRPRSATWNIDRCGEEEWNSFRDELGPRLEEWKAEHERLLASGCDAQSSVSGSAALLEVAITKAAAKSIGARFTYPQKRKPWIDATVLELIHRRDDLLALCNEETRNNGGTSAEASRLREEYQRQCRAVRNAIRSRKRQARSKQHKRLEQQQGRQMWQQLRSMIGRGSSSPEIIAREDGSLAHSHKDKLLTAREYFERLGRDTAPAGTFDDAFGAFVS
ncbi:MAG: hypothetical protein GJU76_13775, partial [Gallionella sp.]|nr:hypothetical protein [Gallionella sp.]